MNMYCVNEPLANRLRTVTVRAVAGTLLALALSTSVHASVLFSNFPDAHVGANFLGSPGAGSQEFSLVSASTITSMTISVWTQITGPSSINWNISSDPTGVGSVASGTSAVSNSFNFNNGIYNIFDSTFAISNVALGAGAWFATLTSDNPTGYDNWGVTFNGLGTQQSFTSSNGVSWSDTSSSYMNTLIVEGTTGNVPEPSIVTLLALALALAGLAVRSRKRA